MDGGEPIFVVAVYLWDVSIASAQSKATAYDGTLIGGKQTTCRALAEEVANRVLARRHLPRIANSHVRPIADVRNSTIPEILKHEWVRTLSDLVERRLLLIFDPTLDQSRLQELAALLADEGVIRSDQIDSEAIPRTDQFEVTPSSAGTR